VGLAWEQVSDEIVTGLGGLSGRFKQGADSFAKLWGLARATLKLPNIEHLPLGSTTLLEGVFEVNAATQLSVCARRRAFVA
jgi:hypothetical protein